MIDSYGSQSMDLNMDIVRAMDVDVVKDMDVERYGVLRRVYRKCYDRNYYVKTTVIIKKRFYDNDNDKCFIKHKYIQ